MLDRISLEDFLPHVGSGMDVNAHGRSARFTLKEAALINSPSPRESQPFHLIWSAPLDCRLPQGLYRVQHPQLGELELFTVPLGPDGKAFCYEAVFN